MILLGSDDGVLVNTLAISSWLESFVLTAAQLSSSVNRAELPAACSGKTMGAANTTPSDSAWMTRHDRRRTRGRCKLRLGDCDVSITSSFEGRGPYWGGHQLPSRSGQ